MNVSLMRVCTQHWEGGVSDLPETNKQTRNIKFVASDLIIQSVGWSSFVPLASFILRRSIIRLGGDARERSGKFSTRTVWQFVTITKLREFPQRARQFKWYLKGEKVVNMENIWCAYFFFVECSIEFFQASMISMNSSIVKAQMVKLASPGVPI